ncbi:B3 domain-containing protein Os01g0723500-like isoform X1 [Rosa rugosa]|uniref:B3 domain-containing protein Os01g0723500-like isoform X1 n=1 Tax=Rosa rugosa TaxID=74645 RepID=UPI002B416A27|nr:B3 domain-containing protein Os01g0723500-like isoform X1 [Rosa rugosa]XP_061992702.1 B3 domain-containing protein Os01g0723500-like isoform X1 [Rosa rugosa]
MARRACTSLPFHDGSVEEEKGPTFFKIIRPGFNTEHLRIPPAFRKHILHESTKRATLKLKNSSDTSWTVKVSITGRDIYLKDGWQEFLRENSLGDSEFLVFRYDKNMHFIINIFDKNCVERVNITDLRTHKASTFPDNTKGPLARPPTAPGDHRYDSAVEAAHVLKSKGEHLPSYAAAAAFKSKFPYFAKVLAGSKMVAIPTHFYREIFSSSKYDELFLVTSKGKFTVTLLPCTDTVMLSGGWSSFRNDNQLQEDDICIFELVKENTMVVHIFRN